MYSTLKWAKNIVCLVVFVLPCGLAGPCGRFQVKNCDIAAAVNVPKKGHFPDLLKFGTPFYVGPYDPQYPMIYPVLG